MPPPPGRKRDKNVPKQAWTVPQWSGKTPRAAQAPGDVIKQPRSLGVNHDAILLRQPVWRFGDVDHGGPWCFDGIRPADLVNILKKLGSYETMTVGELFRPGSRYGKTYSVDDMPAGGPARLLELEHDDETEISRVLLTSKSRLYGFLREHVFYVLWYDPEHEVWPSKKKHT